MSPSAKKQFNTAVGGLFIGLGVIAWGVAVLFAVKPSDKRSLPPVVLAETVQEISCRQTLNTLFGFTTRIQGGELIVTSQDLSNPQKVLNDATAAIGLCKRELSTFCMGTGCPEPGMTMTLSLSDSQIRAQGMTELGGAVAPSAASSVGKK